MYYMYGAQWPSGLERWIGDRVALGSNPAAATSLRNFGNSVYPALTVPSEDTLKSVGSFCPVYAREVKKIPLEMSNLSWTPPLLEKDNSKK